MSIEKHRENEERLLNEVFNLDVYYEFVDEEDVNFWHS